MKIQLRLLRLCQPSGQTGRVDRVYRRFEAPISAHRPVIVLTANSLRNLAHFRRPLFEALKADGFALAAIAPNDLQGKDRPEATIFPIPIDRGGTNPAKDLATTFAYVATLRRLRPAAVLSFTPKANIYGGLAARLFGIPLIPNVSGLGTGYLRGGFIRRVSLFLYRQAFSACPVVFFQNPDDRDEFVRVRLVRPEQAELLPGSGIDLHAFSPHPQPVSEIARLLFVGRFLADKGLRELVEAVSIVNSVRQKVELTLVGSSDTGNPSSIPEQEVENWRHTGQVTVAGEHADVRPFIADADAVVLPSYREGLPRVLLEAAAMGRPMIATDVPGCREVVKEGETGFLCEPANAASLAQAIERFLDLDTQERSSLGQAARQLAVARFDEARVVEKYREALSRIGVESVVASA